MIKKLTFLLIAFFLSPIIQQVINTQAGLCPALVALVMLARIPIAWDLLEIEHKQNQPQNQVRVGWCHDRFTFRDTTVRY